MTELIPLQHLLARGRDDAHGVAVSGGAVLDFAGFRNAVAGWRRVFEQAAERGRPGKWALYFEDGAEFAAALFGIWHSGGSAHLPPDVQPATLARLAQAVDGFVGAVPREYAPLQPVDASDAGRAQWRELDLDAEAVVVWTSGSTGEPLPVAKSLRQLAAETQTLASRWDAQLGDSRVLATVPHQHIYGLLFAVLWPLIAGRIFAAKRLAQWGDLREAAGGEPVTLVTSPAHLKRAPVGKVEVTLRAVFSSGGNLPAEASEHSSRYLGIVPTEIYGSTETGGIAWRGGSQRWWLPLPGVQIDTAHEQLRVRSPHLPDAAAWYATADRVQPRAEGFELLGRADRVVKLEEKRVSLQSVERALLRSELVTQARALVLGGSRDELAVVVQPSVAGWELLDARGRTALNGALQDLLFAELPRGLLPRRWRYLSDWPVDPLGKTSVSMLEALFDPRRPYTRLRSRTEATAEMSATFPASSPYFGGHFPATPVLPGVAQLEWIILLARELFALPPQVQCLEAVKFHRAAAPDTELLISFEYSARQHTLSYRIVAAAHPVASGRVIFGAPP